MPNAYILLYTQRKIKRKKKIEHELNGNIAPAALAAPPPTMHIAKEKKRKGKSIGTGKRLKNIWIRQSQYYNNNRKYLANCSVSFSNHRFSFFSFFFKTKTINAFCIQIWKEKIVLMQPTDERPKQQYINWTQNKNKKYIAIRCFRVHIVWILFLPISSHYCSSAMLINRFSYVYIFFSVRFFFVLLHF